MALTVGVITNYFMRTLRVLTEAVWDRHVEREFTDQFLHSCKELRMKYSSGKHFIEINR